ncbi:MAG: hypothetical protein AAFR59_11945 [Bacteroidota bacterium]
MKLALAFICTCILLGMSLSSHAQQIVSAPITIAFQAPSTWHIQPSLATPDAVSHDEAPSHSTSHGAQPIFKGEDAADWKSYESEVYTPSPVDEDELLISYLPMSNSQAPAQTASRALPARP